MHRAPMLGTLTMPNSKTLGFKPDIHHRRSIRLKGYDYSKAGLYFITIALIIGCICLAASTKRE